MIAHTCSFLCNINFGSTAPWPLVCVLTVVAAHLYSLYTQEKTPRATPWTTPGISASTSFGQEEEDTDTATYLHFTGVSYTGFNY